jgi:predicted Zn-dependent protease
MGRGAFQKPAFGILAVLHLSCASTNLPSIHETSSNFNAGEDEKQLWAEAESLEKKFAKSGLLYEDPDLDAYLKSVLQKLLPLNLKASEHLARIKVIKNPLLNAFAMPHGSIYLHSGILARMETEDQLATVMGHELIHFTHRHSLKSARSTTNKQNAASLVRILLGGTAAAFGGGLAGAAILDITGQLSTGWLLASVHGYSRELETEADTEGFALLVKADYTPTEAIRVFELLQRDLDERRIKEPFFFGTHPRLQERIDNYRELIATNNVTRAPDSQPRSEEFLKSVNPLLLMNAGLDLNMGRVNTAQAAIERHLQRQPRSARAYQLLGEAYRRGGTDEVHVQQALKAYHMAAEIDPQYPEPHRELGLLYRAQKSVEQAREEFGLYLKLNPKATDAPIINGYLKD